MAQEPNIPLSVLRSLLDKGTFNLITSASKDIQAAGGKRNDVIPTRFDVANAVQPAAKSQPKKGGKRNDVIPTRFDVANAVQPAKSELAETAEQDKDSYMERVMNAAVDKGREAQMKSFQDAIEDGLRESADSAKEAASEADDEVAEMAALTEQEESPSMSYDYAGMSEDGSSVEYQAEKDAEMKMPEEEAAPKAKMALTPDQAKELFKTVHGSEFDPNSSMDKRKLKEIEETALEMGGLEGVSPNQFALKIYRKYKYV